MSDTANYYASELITLDPAQYPPPTVTMQTFAPADAGGAIELGDPWVDSETVQALHDAVIGGIFTLDPAWADTLMQETNAVLETKFLERLRRTPMSGSSPTLHHRRMALYEAMKEIGAAGTVPGFGFGVHNVTRAIGDIETWLEGKRQELVVLGLTEPEITRLLTMVTPAQLAAMLQTSETNLAQWRETKRGPAYAKVSQRTVRYPVAAVLEWLQGAINR